MNGAEIRYSGLHVVQRIVFKDLSGTMHLTVEFSLFTDHLFSLSENYFFFWETIIGFKW